MRLSENELQVFTAIANGTKRKITRSDVVDGNNVILRLMTYGLVNESPARALSLTDEGVYVAKKHKIPYVPLQTPTIVPISDEDELTFVQRAMSDKIMMDRYPNSEARLIVCKEIFALGPPVQLDAPALMDALKFIADNK